MAILKINNFKLTDENKANLNFEHWFNPIKDDTDFRVLCSYIKSGDSANYIVRGETNTFDLNRLVKDYVKKVEGLYIADEDGEKLEITTADQLLMIPGAQATQIFSDIAVHILNGADLTETEVEN